MKMMVIPIIIGVLGTVTKELVQGVEAMEIRRQEETMRCFVLSLGEIQFLL